MAAVRVVEARRPAGVWAGCSHVLVPESEGMPSTAVVEVGADTAAVAVEAGTFALAVRESVGEGLEREEERGLGLVRRRKLGEMCPRVP